MALTDASGDLTGNLVFIRYCANCCLGLPLSMYVQGRTQCKRCLDRAAAKSAAGPVGDEAAAAPSAKWATHDTALPLDHAYGPGLCQAVTCWAEVKRRGEGPDTETRPLPLCPDHMEVCLLVFDAMPFALAVQAGSTSHDG